MASAGSFVHGTGAASEERLLRQSKEEQDIADFMSSIDDTSSGGSTSVLRGGSSAGSGGDIFLGSLSPPALQQATSTSAAGELGADDGKAIAEAFPADWLNDFEGLGLGVEGKTGSSAAPAAASQPTQSSSQGQQPPQLQQRQQQRDKDDQQQHRDATIQSIETEEILGAEPEILDNVDGGYGSGAAAAGMLMSAGGRMVSWAANTPASLVDAATGAFRGDAHHAVSRNAGDDLGNGSAAAASAADELPLDWQGTLDMVGMAEAETDATKGTSALAAAPVSELPSLPPPAAREGSFPDFVEIRDPRNVSQFPKPDNALVAKAAGGAGGGGDGQAGQGAGDSDEHAAAGQEHGQRQVLPAPLRTVEVYLRPDVTWESVSDVYMAVMLSRGLVVRHQTEKMVRRLGGGRALQLNVLHAIRSQRDGFVCAVPKTLVTYPPLSEDTILTVSQNANQHACALSTPRCIVPSVHSVHAFKKKQPACYEQPGGEPLGQAQARGSIRLSHTPMCLLTTNCCPV